MSRNKKLDATKKKLALDVQSKSNFYVDIKAIV